MQGLEEGLEEDAEVEGLMGRKGWRGVDGVGGVDWLMDGLMGLDGRVFD